MQSMCYLCKKDFKYHYRLQRHLTRKSTCNPNIPFKCNLCKKTFMTYKQELIHTSSQYHKNILLLQLKSKIYQVFKLHKNLISRLLHYFKSTPKLQNYYMVYVKSESNYDKLSKYLDDLKKWNFELKKQIKYVVEIDKYIVANMVL